MFRCALPGLVLLLSSCVVGGDDPPPGGGADAGVEADAMPDPSGCDVPASLGALGVLDAEATRVNQNGSMGALKIYRVNANLNQDAERDLVSIQLWDARGAFGEAVTPGTYALTGAEANFSTCGACVTVLGNLVPMQGARSFFIAQSGTLQLDSVTPTLSGSLSDVTLAEFDLATGAPIAGGCTTSIESASFSDDVEILD